MPTSAFPGLSALDNRLVILAAGWLSRRTLTVPACSLHFDSRPPSTVRAAPWRRCLTTCCAVVCCALAGCSQTPLPETLPANLAWDDISRQAQGKTVRMAMWDGDPLINAYMRNYVAAELQRRHGITLELIGVHGQALVNRLLVDLETGRSVGDLDLVWINGATFYQLRQLQALYGPFTERLPNNQYIDWQNPFIGLDFQQPVAGYECPWGNVQLALIFDSERLTEPPQTVEQLAAWIRAHPGRFTLDNGFTGMTFLKSLLSAFAGGREVLHGPFDEQKYEAAANKLWVWLRDLQPDLWREGRTFPDGVAQLHQLFSNNEVDFTMSNNDGEVDNKVLQGILPETARGYVPEFGTIRNSHYLGIPLNAPQKAAALTVINFLISPEAQLQKAQPAVWGDGTVLASHLLPEQWRNRLQNIAGRERVPGRDLLQQRAIMEPAPEIMIRIHADFRREIIERAP